MTILPGWGVARLPERPGQDRSSHRLGAWKKSILLPPRMSRACRKLFLDRRPVACPGVVPRDPTHRRTLTNPAREDTDPTEQTGGLHDPHQATHRHPRAPPAL